MLTVIILTMKAYFWLRMLGNLFWTLGVGIFIFTYIPIAYGEVSYRAFPHEVAVTEGDVTQRVKNEQENPDGRVLNISPYEAINPEFSIIIPKIDVNAPIVSNVSMANEKEYMNALRQGVAHARGTSMPGETGNIFLFAHSSINFWQLGPYATVFNLLNKLEKGDVIVIAYQGVYYEYAFTDMTVVPGWDTSPFDVEYDDSVITLITCDPPGTTLNRRVVKARLLNTIRP